MIWAAVACVLGIQPTEARPRRSKKPVTRAGQGHILASRGGLASWHAYGNSRMITASRTYPCGSCLRVTNAKTGKSVVVRVGDWGPAGWTGRALDLNRVAFAKIAPLGGGEVRVKYQLLARGNCRIHNH